MPCPAVGMSAPVGMIGYMGNTDLVRRVAAKARATEERLPECASEAEIAVAEAELGFALPPLLARLYREVANGGFGPGQRLLPVSGPGPTVVTAYWEEREPDPGGGWYWPRGVTPVLDWGCGMYAAVDCLDERAPVLLYEPNPYGGGRPEAWFHDAPSLAAWLEKWLTGRWWWDEEPGSDAAALVPWPNAAGRLAG